MKRSALFLLLSILVYSGYSKQIDENTARLVAKTFFNNFLNKIDIISTDFTLADKYDNTASQLKDNSANIVYFYIFNLIKGNGFIIVSGDDNAKPVLGYSTTGNYDNTNPPPDFLYWLDCYKKQIKYAIENKVIASDIISQKWNPLINGTCFLEKSNVKGIATIEPLQTTWNQNCYYNASCPSSTGALKGYCGRVPTGCVATAMAQIMKYWSYPAKGTGSHFLWSRLWNSFCKF